MPNLNIGIEKYDDEFSIPYNENDTLEQFHEVIEKSFRFSL